MEKAHVVNINYLKDGSKISFRLQPGSTTIEWHKGNWGAYRSFRTLPNRAMALASMKLLEESGNELLIYSYDTRQVEIYYLDQEEAE